MTLVWILAVLVLLAALVYIALPLGRAPEPFPSDPLPEEIQAEIDALKEEAKDLEGAERKRTLGRIVHLERRLAELQGRPQAVRRTGRAPWLALGVVTVLLLVGTAVLLRYLMPAGTVSAVANSQPASSTQSPMAPAQQGELAKLKQKAEKAGDVESWLAYADAAWEAADYNAAAEGYKKVLDLDDKNLKAWKRMGILFYMSGYPKDAASVLSVVVSFDPKDTEALLFLGEAYSKLGRFEEAIGAWKRYIQAGGAQKEYVEQMIKTAEEQLKKAPQAGKPGSLPPDHPPLPKGEQTQAGSELPPDHPTAPAGMEGMVDGKIVYRDKCAACHGQDGGGGIGPALAHDPMLKVDGAVEEIVTRGRGSMPPVQMSKKELDALVEYLKQEM